MTTELKHFAAYLPYGLKVKVVATNFNGVITEMVGLSENHVEVIGIRQTVTEHFEFTDIKPILQPLSEFEYDHIIQIKEHLGLGQWCDHYDQYFDAWFDDAENVQKLVLQCPYEIMQFFLECHFDVFGLINQGLAIDVNTLK